MKKKLSEQTLQELINRRSTLKSALIAFIALAVISAIVLFCLKAKLVLYIPIFTFPITLLPLSIAFKQINDEIKLRDTNSKA